MEMIEKNMFVDMTKEELCETDGGAWWIVVGWVCTGLSAACELTAGIIGLCDGNAKVAGGFAIAGTALGFAGTILTGVKVK